LNIIEALKYLILGIIQGITEVIPVSSSGHVELAQILLNVSTEERLLFLILVNTGSLLTFLIIYFKKIIELIRDFFGYIFKKNSREQRYNNFIFAARIIVACIPAAIVGFFLNDIINNSLKIYGTLFVGVGLLVTATMLYFIKDTRILKGKTMINWTDTLLIGLAQSVAVFPGISRSGMTTATSIKRGMGIDSALNFSFLLYIPLSVGSLVLMLYKVFDSVSNQGMSFIDSLGVPSSEYFIYYFLAFIGAAIATYFAYRLIFNIFKSGKLKYFSYYAFALGLISILYYMTR